jgi:hypothetical protein
MNKMPTVSKCTTGAKTYRGLRFELVIRKKQKQKLNELAC